MLKNKKSVIIKLLVILPMVALLALSLVFFLVVNIPYPGKDAVDGPFLYLPQTEVEIRPGESAEVECIFKVEDDVPSTDKLRIDRIDDRRTRLKLPMPKGLRISQTNIPHLHAKGTFIKKIIIETSLELEPGEYIFWVKSLDPDPALHPYWLTVKVL